MARLGARHTVKGYLDALSARSLLGLDDTNCGEIARQNWQSLLNALPRRWKASEFASYLTDFLEGYYWLGFQESRRTALGREEFLTFCLPSVVDVVHSDANSSRRLWTERGLMVQGWAVRTRDGKAKIRLYPSNVVISEHALERFYERTGGCQYGEFPKAVAELADGIIAKIDSLLYHCVLQKQENSAAITAMPANEGLAVIEICETALRADMPQAGVVIDIRSNRVEQRRSDRNLLQAFRLDDDEDERFGSTLVRFIRTFYGFDELSDERLTTKTCLSMILEKIDYSPTAFLGLFDRENDSTLLETPSGGAEKSALKSWISEARDSMAWLRPMRDDAMILMQHGEGQGFIEMVQMQSHYMANDVLAR